MVPKRLSCNSEQIILMKAPWLYCHGNGSNPLGYMCWLQLRMRSLYCLDSAVVLFLLNVLYKSHMLQTSYVDSDGQSYPASAITRFCFKHDDEDILMAQQCHPPILACHFSAMVGAPH